VTAQITALMTGQDRCEIVRDQIAAILLAESAEQQVLATKGVVSYTRAGDSDYTARSTAVLSQVGVYTVTAGTLVDGVGEWTAEAPDGSTDSFTSSAADDALVFGDLGMTLEVTDRDTPWQTADVIAVTTYDPAQWKLRVFTERTNPWQVWESAPDQAHVDATPLVSVAFQREDFDRAKSDTFEKFHADARFAVDCYGYGKTTATVAGQDPGDAKALSEGLRAARLARRILMAAHYTRLGLTGTVGARFVESVDRFPAELEERFVQHVRAYRLLLAVSFSETSPQVEGQPCEQTSGVVRNGDSGEVFLRHTQAFGS